MKDQILKRKVMQHEEGDLEISTINEGIVPANRVSLKMPDASNKHKQIIKNGKAGQENRIVDKNDFSQGYPSNRITTRDYEVMDKDRKIYDYMDQHVTSISKFDSKRGVSTNRTEPNSPF